VSDFTQTDIQKLNFVVDVETVDYSPRFLPESQLIQLAGVRQTGAPHNTRNPTFDTMISVQATTIC